MIDIFTLASSQVVPDIGINMDKLNGVKWISEKIFQLLTKVSVYSDSE
ncbi:MAG: hypothetical protein ACN4GR_03480 [Arenicellales bacterium]